MTSEELKIKCPVCKKEHTFKPEIQEFFCKGKHLVLLKDRLGWRLMEVREISEREDRELDKVWSSGGRK